MIVTLQQGVVYVSNPRRFEKSLSEYGYHMEVDTRKSDCNRESAHWHLCKNGRRIGQISPYGSWTSYPDVSSSIRKEAEALTSTYASDIVSCYEYNRENGSDY